MPFKANADRRHRIPKQRRRITNWAEYDVSSFSDRGCPANSLLRHFSETGSSPYSIRLSRRVTDRIVAPSLILGADQCSRRFPDGRIVKVSPFEDIDMPVTNIQCQCGKWLNNRVEQDHRRIKR